MWSTTASRMAERRCELLVPVANGWGDASPVAFARTIECTTPVSRATVRPDPELMKLWQACLPNGWRVEEGIIPNGLSLPSEEHSDPHLLAEESGRTRREASHLTYEGYG